ncbi:MAG: GTPase Era, partial [Synergistetes bacterium]|nr:GTPase Era [Synergistota bacterium]
GEPFYPDDILTDKTEREVAAEIVREKLVKLLRQELPYSTAVKIEEFKDRSDNLSYIRAVIYTEKESQKGIIIGKNGEMLKKIGKLARQELEAVFGRKIFLDLWVKVLPNWRNDIQKLRMLGYR